MVNRCGYEQGDLFAGGCEEEMKRMDTVVCPKPRRLSLLNFDISSRWALRYAISRPSINSAMPVCEQMEISESKAGAELLDIILTKGGCSGERSANQPASSPPFFIGSPPSRVSNPLIQDARFGSEKVMALPSPTSSPGPISPSAVRAGGGCVRMKFGQQPAAVRIEGFDCLSRDRRNCSISAMA